MKSPLVYCGMSTPWGRADSATHFSGVCHRRPVKRPDLREVSDLVQYADPFIAELAREMAVDAEELCRA